jgi:hypothetical protein
MSMFLEKAVVILLDIDKVMVVLLLKLSTDFAIQYSVVFPSCYSLAAPCQRPLGLLAIEEWPHSLCTYMLHGCIELENLDWYLLTCRFKPLCAVQ